MRLKKGHQKLWRRKTTFFRKKLDFLLKSLIFSQNVRRSHRNLTWGFLGFFSVVRLWFSNFLEWQRCLESTDGSLAWRKLISSSVLGGSQGQREITGGNIREEISEGDHRGKLPGSSQGEITGGNYLDPVQTYIDSHP